jgi:hypothetical protein
MENYEVQEIFPDLFTEKELEKLEEALKKVGT